MVTEPRCPYYKTGGWHGNALLEEALCLRIFALIDILFWLFVIPEDSRRFADFNHAGLEDFEDSGLVTLNSDAEAWGC
jgi:hypothetical protein